MRFFLALVRIYHRDYGDDPNLTDATGQSVGSAGSHPREATHASAITPSREAAGGLPSAHALPPLPVPLRREPSPHSWISRSSVADWYAASSTFCTTS